MTVGNGQNMKCKLKGLVNMNTKCGETVNITEVLYILQVANKLLSVSRLISKGDTMGDIQGKLTI